MPYAGWAGTIKVSGTPTAFTNEATTALGGNVFQITNSVRRIVDPATAITVKDNGVTVPATSYTFDYLYGKVRGYAASPGPITVDGSYLPLLTVADAVSAAINQMRELLETTSFDSAAAASGARRFLAGLKGADGELEIVDVADTDLDGGAGTVVLATLMDAGTPKLLEVGLGNSGAFWRGWILLEGLARVQNVKELPKTTVRWRACGIVGAGQTEAAYFGVGS
jgi:hypothetical protein